MGTLYAGFDLRGNHNYLGIIDGDGKREGAFGQSLGDSAIGRSQTRG